MDSFVRTLAKPEEAHLPLAVASIVSFWGRYVLSEVESVTARRCPWSSEVFRFLHSVEVSMFTLALLALLGPKWSNQMKNLLGDFWSDEAGFVLSAELVLISSVAVIGVVTGMSRVRGALIEEFDDVAESLTSLDQSYSYGGFKGCKSFTAGSAYYEDGREVEIDFTEIYREQPCVKPLASPPQQEFIVEPLPCNDCLPQPCNDCLPAPVIEEECCPQELLPLPAPAPAPNSAITSVASPCCGSGLNAFGGDSGFVPAQRYAGIGYYGRHYQGVDGNPQKIILPYENSVYNVKRYIDTPYHPLAPHTAPRSSVW